MARRLLDREIRKLHSAFVEAAYSGNEKGFLTDEQLEDMLILLNRIDEATEEEVLAFALSLRQKGEGEEHVESPQTPTDASGGEFVDEDDPRTVLD